MKIKTVKSSYDEVMAKELPKHKKPRKPSFILRSIINIGSYMGILGPDYNLYKGTDMNANGAIPDYFFHKGGITNYTRFLASHYGDGRVRSNCIELGGLFNNQNPLFVERYNAKCPLGRMANQTDLKGLIVYLASDASLYMTGAIIPLDGGYSVK